MLEALQAGLRLTLAVGYTAAQALLPPLCRSGHAARSQRACLSPQKAHVPEALQAGLRVTLAMGEAPQPEPSPDGEGEVLPAWLVPPSEPRTAAGMYWGATTRLASGLHTALTECPFEVRTIRAQRRLNAGSHCSCSWHPGLPPVLTECPFENTPAPHWRRVPAHIARICIKVCRCRTRKSSEPACQDCTSESCKCTSLRQPLFGHISEERSPS